MHTNVGDKILIGGRTIGGIKGWVGEILEVCGSKGDPPYLVRFNNGHEALVYPGPDTIIFKRRAPEEN